MKRWKGLYHTIQKKGHDLYVETDSEYSNSGTNCMIYRNMKDHATRDMHVRARSGIHYEPFEDPNYVKYTVRLSEGEVALNPSE